MKFFANDICNVYIIFKRFAPLTVKCYDELAIFKLKGVQVIGHRHYDHDYLWILSTKQSIIFLLRNFSSFSLSAVSTPLMAPL